MLSCYYLFSKFDIAAYIVHVGGVYTSNQHQKQWVFVTDGSIMNGLKSEKLINSLLAICFCSPLIDHDSSFPLISCNLAGSTVFTMHYLIIVVFYFIFLQTFSIYFHQLSLNSLLISL